MVLSGMFFSRIESRRVMRESESVESEPVAEPETEELHSVEAETEQDEYKDEWETVDYETAAAIAVALHLHFESSQSPAARAVASRGKSREPGTPAAQPDQSRWSNHGREEMMRARSMLYNRGNS